MFTVIIIANFALEAFFPVHFAIRRRSAISRADNKGKMEGGINVADRR